MSFFERIGWHPSIGDPSFLGWFTVFAYAYVAYLSFSVARNGVFIFREGVSRQVNLWAMIALLFALLAINKQLDLQSFFTATAKFLAKKQGWYDARRSVQVAFIVGVLLCGVVVLIGLLLRYRKYLKTNLVALAGLCFIICFVAIRATSFHHFDRLIGTRMSQVLNFNHVLELSGIFLVGANALWLLNQRYRHRPRRSAGSS